MCQIKIKIYLLEVSPKKALVRYTFDMCYLGNERLFYYSNLGWSG